MNVSHRKSMTTLRTLARDFTRESIAAEVGVHSSSIGNWLTGRHRPSAGHRRAILQAAKKLTSPPSQPVPAMPAVVPTVATAAKAAAQTAKPSPAILEEADVLARLTAQTAGLRPGCVEAKAMAAAIAVAFFALEKQLRGDDANVAEAK